PLEPEQIPCIAGQNPLAFHGGDIKRFDRAQRVGNEAASLFGIERRIGGKEAGGGAEEGMAAASRRLLSKRSIGIEHLEIVDWRLLQTALLRERVTLRRAEENLPKAKFNLAGEIGDHAAHVMRDDLQRR